MAGEKLPTKFLPAERAEPAEVERQRRLFPEAAEITSALDGMLNFTLVLNRQRQAVFINKAFMQFLDGHGIEGPIGRRPGELAGCVHSTETPGGCGTTESCSRCGSALAIEQALNGKEAETECA